MTDIQLKRYNDFEKILTYHLVSKIQYSFKGNFDLYYSAPKIWRAWRNRQLDYDKINPYAVIIKFNQTALSSRQMQAIAGHDDDGNWVQYGDIVKYGESTGRLRTYSKGTLVVKDRRYGIKTRYELPYDYIKSIFDDKNLLAKVLDAGSDYYTDRQRRLIFTQINRQKNYKYKTNKRIKHDEELARYEQEAAEIIDMLDVDL